MTDDVLYSALHWAEEAKESAQQAALAVGQVGNGIIPVICCKSSAPVAETVYKVQRTTFSPVRDPEQEYGYVRTAGSGEVARSEPIYWDKRCVYLSYGGQTSTLDFEYTGATQVNSLTNGDMYYNTTDNKIYTWDSTNSVWVESFTVNNTVLVLDKNTNKLMHLYDGKLEGVYRL